MRWRGLGPGEREGGVAPLGWTIRRSLPPRANQSVLHDEAHLAERLAVRERVALHRDEIGALAAGAGADLAVGPAGLGAAPRPRDEGVVGRDEEPHAGRELEGHEPVHAVGARGDADARG